MVDITIGADPEFFLYIDGKIIPADKFLNSKSESEKTEGGLVYYDGMAAEINPVPETSTEKFIENIRLCLRYIYKETKASFLPVASVILNSDDIKDARCERRGNIIPNKDGTFTCCTGGHIHLSYPFDREVISALDATLGVFSVAKFHGDEERRRKRYFGHAGNCKIQKHGFEYKVLSSAWLASPELAAEILDFAKTCILLYDSNRDFYKQVDKKQVKQIINQVDFKQARAFVQEIMEFLPGYEAPSLKDRWSPHEMLKNWGIIY